MNKELSCSTESLLDEISSAGSLFSTLDKDGSGYIEHSDLATFCTDLSEDDLWKLFQELDRDGDGRISVRDFKEGFKIISKTVVTKDRERRRSSIFCSKPYSRGSSNATSLDDLDENKQLGPKSPGPNEIGMIGLGECLQSLSNQEQILDFYSTLSEEKPQLVDSFETILADLMKSISDLKTEVTRLEKTLDQEKDKYAKSLHDLQAEMEHQIHRADKEAITRQIAQKEEEYKEKLAATEQECNSLREQITHLQTCADSCHMEDGKALKEEIDKITAEKKQLCGDLTSSETRLLLALSEISQLKQSLQDKEMMLKKEKETLSEHVKEQDKVTQQLHQLHQANRQLRDANDCLRQALEDCSNTSSSNSRDKSRRLQQQHILAESSLRICDPNYRKSIEIDSDNPDSGLSTLKDVAEIDSEAESSFSRSFRHSSRSSNNGQLSRQNSVSSKFPMFPSRRQILPIETDTDDDDFGLNGARGYAEPGAYKRTSLRQNMALTEDEDANFSGHTADTLKSFHSNRSLVRSNDTLDGSLSSSRRSSTARSSQREKGSRSRSRGQEKSRLDLSAPVHGTPERMFKVVLAGDAAVGKTSLITRLCDNKFVEHTSTTLGVDFKTRNINVDGHIFGLQLWDTAGQERFRSIAKSYFRRADGVLLLYDCTYERSFLSVREWIDTVQDAADKNIPIMMVSNKVDQRSQCQERVQRCIQYTEGRKLAQEYQSLFIETSAKDGSNILQCVTELARLMQANEDIEVNKTNVQLSDLSKPTKETKCCDF